MERVDTWGVTLSAAPEAITTLISTHSIRSTHFILNSRVQELLVGKKFTSFPSSVDVLEVVLAAISDSLVILLFCLILVVAVKIRPRYFAWFRYHLVAGVVFSAEKLLQRVTGVYRQVGVCSV